MWLRCRFYDFWVECKRFAVLLAICLLFGVVFGILSGNSITGVVLVDDVKERSLLWLYTKAGSASSFLVTGIWETIILFGIILIVNVNIYFLPMNYFVSVYKGYLIGYNSIVVIKFFGLSGAAGIIFVFLPQQIIQVVCFLAVSCWANLRCYNFKTSGLFCFCGVEYPLLFKRVFYWILVALAFSMVFSFIFGSLASSAII